MIVWDRGLWIPLEEPEQGLRKGKLLFELRGYKLRGEWTLVRTKTKDRPVSKEWLLIKHRDGWAGPESQRAFPQDSVYSGLTVEELEAGADRAAALREAELARSGATRGPVRAEGVKLMLAEAAAAPFSSPDWLFELKYDGFRLLAERDGERARLLYRRGSDASAIFPELTRALKGLPYPRFVLDGEVVVLEDDGRPSFPRLQQRALLQRPADAARAALQHPATLYAFDLLAFEDFDLRALPLEASKELLRQPAAAQRAAALLRPRPRAGPGPVRAGPAPGPRGPDGQAPRRAVPRWPLGPVAQAQGRAHRRLRGGGTLATRGDPGRLRGPAPGGLRGRAPGLRRQGRQRLQRAGAARDPRGPRGRAAPHAALRGRAAAGARHALGRAAARGRGALQGVAPRPAAARPGLRALARRQAAGRVPPGRPVAGRTRAAAARPDAVAPGRGRAAGGLQQPGQGLLARRGLHQGRPGRVLPRRGAGAAAAAARPAGGADTLPRRHRGQELLPEGRPRLRPRLGAHRAHVERARPPRDRLLRGGRARDPALPGQPGHHPAARLVEPGGEPGPARLVHPRPRPQGRPLRARAAAGAGAQGPVRRDRPALVLQDQRLDRPARAGAAGAPVHLRAVASARGAAGARDRGGRARDRHHHAGGGEPRRAGLPGLPAERPRPPAGERLQRAAAARRAGLGAARVARGRPGPRPARLHHPQPARAPGRPGPRAACSACSSCGPTWARPWRGWGSAWGRLPLRRGILRR